MWFQGLGWRDFWFRVQGLGIFGLGSRDFLFFGFRGFGVGFKDFGLGFWGLWFRDFWFRV